jgi:hypothetical protein
VKKLFAKTVFKSFLKFLEFFKSISLNLLFVINTQVSIIKKYIAKTIFIPSIWVEFEYISKNRLIEPINSIKDIANIK